MQSVDCLLPLFYKLALKYVCFTCKQAVFPKYIDRTLLKYISIKKEINLFMTLMSQRSIFLFFLFSFLFYIVFYFFNNLINFVTNINGESRSVQNMTIISI